MKANLNNESSLALYLILKDSAIYDCLGADKFVYSPVVPWFLVTRLKSTAHFSG